MSWLSDVFQKGGPFFIVNTFFLAVVIGLIVERANERHRAACGRFGTAGNQRKRCYGNRSHRPPQRLNESLTRRGLYAKDCRIGIVFARCAHWPVVHRPCASELQLIYIS